MEMREAAPKEKEGEQQGLHNLSVQSNKSKVDRWYDDVFDVLFDAEDRDNIDEKDIIMAVEASIFAMEFGIEQCELGQRDEAAKFNDGEITYYDLKSKRVISRKLNLNGDGEPPSIRRFPRSKSMESSFFNIRKYFSMDDQQEHESDEEQDDEGQENKNGLFGQQNITDGWFLSQYFKDDSKDNRHKKKFIALMAWSIAGLGLVLALCFLTRDFVTSSMENASTIEYQNFDELSLPKLWLCPTGTQQPMFFSVPDGYYGEPLFWIDYLKGGKDNLNVTYPATKDLAQVNYTSITSHGELCNGSSLMNPSTFHNENFERPYCFYCIVLNTKPALSIRKPGVGEEATKRHLSLRLSRQSFPAMCRTVELGVTLDIINFLRWEMVKYSAELEERGTLRFGGLDPKKGENIGFLFPLWRAGGWNTTTDVVVTDVVDMLCNVYMFSGFFYPAERGDVRFEFDALRYRWRRAGAGPFSPPSYEEAYGEHYGEFLTKRLVYEDNLRSRVSNESVLTADVVEVLTNSSRLRTMETMTKVRPNWFVSMSLTRNEVNGDEFFDTHTIGTMLEVGDTKTVNDVYFIDFMFNDFFTRRVTRQQAMSWTAFLADFFGLTSLFLDISVYTILVSPIAGKREAHKHKRRKHENELERRAQRAGWSR